MNMTKQKNRLYFFFSLICVFLLSVCFLRKYDGFRGEDAHFANYTLLGSDSNGLEFYYDEDNPSKVAVAVGSCDDQDVTVSDKFQGKDVTEIYPAGFQNCSTIETITLPATIDTIGTEAFAGSSLQSITIPDEVKVISTGAFRNCKNLTEVLFEDPEVTTINDYAFANDFNLSSFAFHKIKKLTTIGEEAFLYCLALRTVIFPDTFKTLKSYAFQDCKGLVTIYFPGSIQSIGYYAFKGVGDSARIYFSESRATTVSDCSINDPNVNTTIPFEYNENFSYGDHYIPVTFDVGDLKILGPFRFSRPNNNAYPLYECTTGAGEGDWDVDASLPYETETIADDEVVLMNYEDDGVYSKTTFDIPATVEWDKTYKVVGISNRVFKKNQLIESVTFHENLRFIDYEAFAECPKLTKINLQEATDLKYIQSRAFYGAMPVDGHYDNEHLYSIHIPASVERIAQDAFRGCRGLFRLYFDGATDKYEETFLCPDPAQDGSFSFDLAYDPRNIESVTFDGPALTKNTSEDNYYSVSGKTIKIAAGRKTGVAKVTYTTDSTSIRRFKGQKVGNSLVTDFALSCEASAVGSVAVTTGEQTVIQTLDTDYTVVSESGENTVISFVHGHEPAVGSEIIVSYRAKSNLKQIDEYAFYKCSNGFGDHDFYGTRLWKADDAYQKVFFPDSLETIGESAFQSGEFIGGVVFPTTIPGHSLTINASAFASHNSLSSIVFPTTISGDNTKRLKIGGSAFASGLGKTTYLAGSGYKKLISVTLPSKTTVTGNNIFGGHLFLSIYCIANEPTKSNAGSWNKVVASGNMYESLGDFKKLQYQPNSAPVYTVSSASDIVTLPSKEHPIFDFVRKNGGAILTNYHFYGGRIKDSNGNTAIKPGATLTDYSSSSINSAYNSEYLVKLNGHFRAEIPAKVKFNGTYADVIRIGRSSLSIQTNESTMVPFNNNGNNVGTGLTNNDSYRYWQENKNYWTMREITLPNSITTIDECSMAFVPFTTLRSYTNTKDSSDGLSKIWDGVSTGITEGRFPSSLTSIGRMACAFCGITKASLPDCLTDFGSINKTASGTALTESFYTFPFIGCFDLEELSIYDDGIVNTPTFLTNEDGGIISYIDSSNNEVMIEGAEAIDSMEIKWGTASILNGALRGGRQIKSVSFPYTISQIPTYLMDTIGASIDSQGWNKTSRLRTVTFASAEECGEDAAQREAHPLPECTAIGESAFSGCANLVNMELPKGLTTLGPKVFWNCTNLGNMTEQDDTGITIDNGTSASSPYTPNGNTAMGNDLDFTKITTVNSIGFQCFSDCTSLNSVKTSSSIGALSDQTFQNCKGLTSVTFDEQTKSFGTSCFDACDHLTSVTIPSGSNLGSKCFQNCDRMTSVAFNGGANTINSSCFNSCDALSSVTFAALSSATFENNAFDGCKALKSFNIPSGSTVKNNVFNKCTGLDDNHATGGGIIVGDSVSFKGQVGSSAFSGCQKDAVIYLMDSESTYTYAQTDHGNDKARYPNGWNYYDSTHALKVYCYFDNGSGSDVAGSISHWRYVNGVPTPW